jgi:hypothetical protein
MKKVYVILVLVVMGVFSFSAAFVAFAQSSPEKAETGIYVVKEGDTLWWLEGIHRGDPVQWRRIVEENPFLKEPGRIYEKGGKTIALIRPGEQLKGLVELGIIPKEIPISDLKVPAPVPVSKPSAWYLWLLIGFAIAAAMYGLYRLLRLFSDPATAGQPIVRGGIPADRPRDIEGRFQQIAETRIASGEPIPQRVGPIEAGFLSGWGRVQYRDHTERKRLKREPAYRARFRFTNGVEEDLFFLQRCANDVRFGARYRGFRFEPAGQVAAEPQPAGAQAGVVRPPLGVATDGAPVKIQTNGLEISAPEGSVFAVAGDKITIAVSRACDITVAPKKVKKTKATRREGTA